MRDRFHHEHDNYKETLYIHKQLHAWSCSPYLMYQVMHRCTNVTRKPYPDLVTQKTIALFSHAYVLQQVAIIF